MAKNNFAQANGFNNVAVIIGINNYIKSQGKFKPLNNAAKDAVDLATVLHHNYQYTVHLLTDDEQILIDKKQGNLLFDSVEEPTCEAIDTFLKQKLPQIVKINKSRKLETCFLFYFAGHGEAEKSNADPKGFLIPKDAQDDRTNWLEMAHVFTDLSKSGCHHVLTVLDSCYSGASLWAVVGRGAEIVRSPFYKEHLERYKKQSTQLLMYSADYNQEASDGNRGASNESENSPFAATLINVLKHNVNSSPKTGFASKGIITASQLFSEIQQSLSNAHQQPGFYPLKREFVGREYIFYNPQFDETELGNAPPINEQNNPYRGLQAFEQRHAAVFRGRAALTEQLCECLHLPVTHSLEKVQSKLEYLQSQASGEEPASEEEPAKSVLPLTVVLGNSGSGKSSLVQAGLLPLLHQIQFAQSWNAATSNEAKRLIFQDYSDDKKSILKILGMKEQETALRQSVRDFPALVRKFLPSKPGRADDKPGENKPRVSWRILDPIRPGEKPFMSLARTFLLIDRPDLLNHEVFRHLDRHFKELVKQQQEREKANQTKAPQLSSAELAKIQFAQSWDNATREARLLMIRDYYDIEKNTIQDIELSTLPLSESIKDFYSQVKTALEALEKRLDDDSPKDEPAELVEIIQIWYRAQQPNQPKLLLVIDQLEELITLDRSDKAKKKFEKDKLEQSVSDRFLNTILATLKAHSDRFQVIMTLRSDFEPRFLTTPLQDWLSYSRFPVRPMSSDELRQAIEEPAQVHALEFKPPELVGQLIDELGQPGALPLLSFVLSELYLDLADRRKADSKDRTLVLDKHKQSGGIVGFLTRRATIEYEKLGGLEYTLDLISHSSGKTLPEVGKRLIAIAQKEQGALHFRIFDTQGHKKDIKLQEAELAGDVSDRSKQLEKLKEFKELLQPYWNGEQIPSATKEEIIVALTSVTGHALEVNQYQKMMRQVMLRMVTIEGGSSAKRRVPQSELDYPRQNNEYRQEVINRLVKARLLVEGRDEGEPYYEPAHDYLIGGWALLQTWIEQEKEDLALQQRLIPAAKDWNERRNAQPLVIQTDQPTEQIARWSGARHKGLQVVKSVAYWAGRSLFIIMDKGEYLKRRLSVFRRRIFIWLGWRQEDADRSYEKPGDYLWDDHPRINQLSFLLDDRSWLNELESEFVRHSIVRRQQIQTVVGTVVISIGAIVVVAGVAAIVGQRKAQIEQAKAATEATNSNLQNGRDLEAVQNAISGSSALDRGIVLDLPLLPEIRLPFFVKPIAEQNNLQEALLQSVYLTKERNRLSLNRGNIYQIATIPANVTAVQTKVRIATVEEEDSVRLLDAEGKQLFQLSTCPTESECTVVYSVALGVVPKTKDNPNNQLLLATGGDGGVISVWNVKSDGTIDNDSRSKLPSVPQSNDLSSEFIDKSVYELAFNSTGTKLASIQNSRVWLWQRNDKGDWQIASQGLTSSSDGTELVSIAFNPLKDQLAVGFNNGQIEIWNVSNISEPKKLQPVNSDGSDGADINAYSLAFSQDGKTLAIGGIGGAVKLFAVKGDGTIDVDSLNTKTVDTQQPKVYSLAFLDNNQLLTVGVSDTVSRYAVHTGEPIDRNPITAQQTEEHQIKSIVYSPNGLLIATVADDDSIRLWNRQGQQLARSVERLYYVQSLAFSPDGRMLVSSGSTEPDFSGTGVIEVWNISSQQPDLNDPSAIYDDQYLSASRNVEFANLDEIVSVGVDGKVTWLTIEKDKTTGNYKFQTSAEISGYDYLANSHNFAFSPTGKQGVIINKNNEIELWDNDKQITLENRDRYKRYMSAAFSPDGTTLATGSADGSVQIWQIELGVNGNIIQEQNGTLLIDEFQTHQQAVNTLAFSPDDPSSLMTGGANGEVKFWDLSQNTPDSSRLSLRNVQTIDFSPSTARSNLIFAWLSGANLLQPVWDQVNHLVNSLDRSVNPNNAQRLAIIDNDKQFKLWDLQPNGSTTLSETNLTPEVKAKLAQAQQLVLNPNGNLLVAIAPDNTITAWNLKSGQAIDWQEQSQTGAIKATDAKFSQDGQILITLGEGEDKKLKLWDVTYDFIQPLTVESSEHRSSEAQASQSTDTQSEDTIDSRTVAALDQVEITPDSQELAILSEDDRLIEFWNLQSLEKSGEFRLPQADSQILFSPDGKLLATVGQDENREVIRLWERTSRNLTTTLELPELTAASPDPDQTSKPEIAFSPDSHLIIARNSERVLSLWDTEGNFIVQLPGEIKSVSFTADGQRLAVVLPNGEISFWSIDRTELLAKACETIRNFEQNSTTSIDPQVCPSISSETGAAFSTGEQLLIPSAINLYKLAGINRFRENNFSEAVQFLDEALKFQQNDPEARIYYNNAKILENPANTEANIYTIAVSVPISSDVDGSQEILRGVAQLQEEANRNGGINGAKLRIMIADDQGEEKVAERIATKLADNPYVLGVIGHFSSNSSLAAGEIYNERHLAAISPISTSVKLSGSGDYFFRTVPNDRQAAQRLADYLLKEIPQPRVAIFYNSESNYSQSLRKEFKKHALDSFNQPVGEYDLAEPSFDAQASAEKAKKNGAEVLVLFANTGELDDALAVVAANVNTVRLPILAGDDLYTLHTLSKIAEREQNPNLVVAVPWNIISNQESDFVKDANQLWHGSVNWRTAMSYDAAKAFVTAIKQIEGEPTRELIAQKLREVTFQGASGQVQFDAEGDRIEEENPQDRGLVRVVNQHSTSKSGTGYDFEPVQTP